jgi:hypothetical protein
MNEVATKPGTWVSGQSGNPSGRPKGKRNELTELKQDLEIAVRQSVATHQVVSIVNKMVDMALLGDVKAAKLILDKFLSNPKDSEDVDTGTGGIVIRIENATFKAQDESNVIDVTPIEVKD